MPCTIVCVFKKTNNKMLQRPFAVGVACLVVVGICVLSVNYHRYEDNEVVVMADEDAFTTTDLAAQQVQNKQKNVQSRDGQRRAAMKGLANLNNMFDEEQERRDKRIEARLSMQLKKDQKMLNSFSTTMTPRERRIRDRLHSDMSKSRTRLFKIQRREQSKSAGETAQKESRLLRLNSQAAADLAKVIRQEKAENAREYKRNVLDLADRRARSAATAMKAAKDSVHDDSKYVSNLKSAISRHRDMISQIERDEYSRKKKRMNERLSAGMRNRDALQQAVQQSTGPVGLSPSEEKFMRKMRKQFSTDAQAISNAVDDTSSRDSKIENYLMKANRKNLNRVANSGGL